MLRRLHRDQSGYSLVEVMVSIIILTVAIIPMVGMFDSGLKAAVLGGNYDTARTVANTRLEEVKTLTAAQVLTEYPPGTTKTPPASKNPANEHDESKNVKFKVQVKSWHTDRAFTAKSNTPSTNCATCLIIEIKVTWDDGSRDYTTTGFKAS